MGRVFMGCVSIDRACALHVPCLSRAQPGGFVRIVKLFTIWPWYLLRVQLI